MTGRPAAQPDPSWRPVSRRRGLIVTFVSEDGTQRKDFDFGSMPGTESATISRLRSRTPPVCWDHPSDYGAPARCGRPPGMAAPGWPTTGQAYEGWLKCPLRMPGFSLCRVGYPAVLARCIA